MPGTLSDISPTVKEDDIKKPDVNGSVFDEQGIVYLYYRMDEYSAMVKRKGLYFLYKNNLIINCYNNEGIVIDRNYMIEVFTKDKIVLREMGYKWDKVLTLTPRKSPQK